MGASTTQAAAQQPKKLVHGPNWEPASCGASTIAPVAGGTPVRNSSGCITAYTVGLILI